MVPDYGRLSLKNFDKSLTWHFNPSNHSHPFLPFRLILQEFLPPRHISSVLKTRDSTLVKFPDIITLSTRSMHICICYSMYEYPVDISVSFMFLRLIQGNKLTSIHKMSFPNQNLPLFRMVNSFYDYKQFFSCSHLILTL